MGENVRISTIAIAQGNLTAKVTKTPQVSQPTVFSTTGTTTKVDRTDIEVDEQGGRCVASRNRGDVTNEIAASVLPASDALKQQTPPSLQPTTNSVEAEKAAEDFEAFFLAQMLEPMFAGLSSAPPFGGGHSEQVFRSLLLQEYGKVIAGTCGVGIADAVKRDILQLEVASFRQPRCRDNSLLPGPGERAQSR